MNKRTVLVFGLIFALMSAFAFSQANLWDKTFRVRSYELMCLKMDDGKILKFTTYHKKKIDRTDFFAFIQKNGYGVSQIEVCIHNHPVRDWADGFSRNDKKFYQQICRHGFKGEFLLYRRGKICNIKDNRGKNE